MSENYLKYSNTAYVCFDEQGQVIEYNKAFSALLYPKEMNENIYRILPESLTKDIKKKLNVSNFQVLKSLEVGEDLREVELYIEFIRNVDSQDITYFLSFTDLSSFKIEEAFSHEKFAKNIQSDIHAGIWTYELATKRIVLSITAQNILEVINLRSQILGLLSKDEKRKVLRSFMICKKVKNSFGIKIETLKGKTLKVTFRFEEGVIGGSILDISKRVSLEKEVEEKNLLLIHNSRLATLGEISASIAHELNNPLAIISGLSLRIKKYIDKNKLQDAQKLMGYSDKILKAVDRSSKIISGLREFATNTPSEVRLEVSFQEVLNKTFDLCLAHFLNSNVDFDVSDIEDKKIYCNPTQLSQVLLNLLNNSFDEVSKDCYSEKWIKVSSFSLGDGYIIRVMDCGEGIPSEVVQKVFDPFFTTKEIDKGTGLGMSISKTIVESFDGKLQYKLIDGHTCFEIFIPIYK